LFCGFISGLSGLVYKTINVGTQNHPIQQSSMPDAQEINNLKAKMWDRTGFYFYTEKPLKKQVPIF
jgi:hypothetical protein